MTSGRDRLVGTGLTVGWRAAQLLPEPVADTVFRAAADRIFRRQGPPVIQLAKNLARVLGEAATPETLSAVVHEAVRSYARYWKETLRLESMDLDEVHRRAVAGTTGLEHLELAREQGRGVILALPHSGNWDIAGLMICRLHGAMTTVAERLEPESLFRRFVDFRESLGMEVLPLTGAGASVSGILKDRLNAGGIVCLLADRDLSRSGIDVDFFGERTRMPPGPAMLASLTGAALCPVHLSYDGTGWRQRVFPPVEPTGVRLRDKVAGATQAMADIFQAAIAEYPADWHMMQPLWTADLRATPEQTSPTGRTRGAVASELGELS
ncbi:phosphatidylinositol mannoside acyltransferase [Nakamurella lactea]|uniref:phosphatidylinositol mannoside acyltransferase n=1 Tax=Nakamurella lactea TaxID=459515 RepID=UPI000406A595|nr:phosphatidylinositol mannoside acyltransferase [Nakamurella lactea]